MFTDLRVLVVRHNIILCGHGGLDYYVGLQSPNDSPAKCSSVFDFFLFLSFLPLWAELV